MTHNFERGAWYKEGLVALGTGTLYGGTSALVGHPMDTVKAKMQAQSGFISGQDSTMVGVIQRIWRNEGVPGFFRGVVPTLWGSSLYRSTQFAIFESVYTRMKEKGLDKHKIPGSGGLAWATLLSAFVGASARSVIESPIEYAKVKRQTAQSWKLREAYQGFFVQWPRTGGMITCIFCLIDSTRRWTDGQALAHPSGIFVTWGTCSMLGFWFVWPLETLKNQVQADTPIEGVVGRPTLYQRYVALGGFRGLYRGIMPGSISVFMRNGCSAVVMGLANKELARRGLR